MRTGIKLSLGTAFVAVAALAVAMFGQVATAQEGTESPKTPATAEEREQRRAQMQERRAGRDGCGVPGAARRPHRNRVVHSETKVQLDEGFGVMTLDHGTITGISGDTVTIERADGVSVSAAAEEGTKVCRNGKPAEVADLQTGDRAVIVQGEAKGETHVRRIAAVSKDSASDAAAA